MLQRAERQETEVMPKAKRRTFTAKYKREIVRKADGCKESGETGALLRREGLYSSHLTVWRRELAAGQLAALAPKKRGPKGKQGLINVGDLCLREGRVWRLDLTDLHAKFPDLRPPLAFD